jgi:hypothetical protein
LYEKETKHFATVVSRTAGNLANLIVGHAIRDQRPRHVKCLKKENGHLAVTDISTTGKTALSLLQRRPPGRCARVYARSFFFVGVLPFNK